LSSQRAVRRASVLVPLCTAAAMMIRAAQYDSGLASSPLRAQTAACSKRQAAMAAPDTDERQVSQWLERHQV
jgi:hypothetical protein